MEHNANHKQSGRFLDVDMRWVVSGGVVASALILLLLLISLITSYASNKRQLTQQFAAVPVTLGVELEVTYPQQLRLNAEPGEMVVGLRVGETAVFTPPLTITLNTPPSIAISGTFQGKHTFTEGNGAPVAFLLVNTAVLPLRQRQTITLTQVLTTTPTTPLTIDVEAPRTAAWREFILGTISDKSPLLLTLAALLPIVTLVLQYVQKQEERELAELEQQQDRRKAAFDQQVKHFYRYLVQVNREGVQDAWQQITQSPLKHTLSFQEQERIECLANLATDRITQPDEETKTRIQANWNEWTAELIGALLCAEHTVKAQAAFYQPILHDVPLEKVADLSLRNQFIRLWRKIDSFDLQANTQDVIPQHDTLQESPLDHLPNLRKFLKRDPFLHMQAEDEETSLLEQEGFWFKHPVCATVDKAVHVQMVYGPSGCGRTTLAKFLAHPNSQVPSSYFWHYEQLHENLTDFSGLRYSLAQRLLHYTTSKPTLLQSVQESQRQILADILVQALTKRTVLAQVETTLDGEVWTKQVAKDQKPIWLKVGITQLALLAQSIETTPDALWMTDTQWMNNLVRAFNLFNFSGVRLLLDCEPDAVEGIILYIPTLQKWQRFGLITTLFIPGSDVDVAVAPKLPLNWAEAQLEQMFVHRFKKLAEDHLHPAELFQDERVYNFFLELASGQTIPLPPTPRKLAQLWQATLENVGEKERIDLDVLKQAKRVMLHWLEETRLSSPERPINPKRLADLLDETFNDNELRSLCFALDEDYDNIGGQTKRNKIEELVQKLNRQGRLPELMEQYRHLRPKRAWQ